MIRWTGTELIGSDACRPSPSPRRAARGWLFPGLLVAALLMGLAVQVAAVSVSPVALYVDNRTRTGTLHLYNPGTLPEEIEIDFAFGYPQSDEEGNVGVNLAAQAPAGEPSALPWLRAFPRRVVLEPGQRQVVRVMVEPPPGLEEGEYWARVLVRSRGGQPPIEQQQGDVTVQIDVETVVVVAFSYRNGAVRTGLEVQGADARMTEDGVEATVDLLRRGNAAFIGRVHAELLDGAGRVVDTREDVLAVYRELRRRLVVPVPDGATGPFRVRFLFDTRRDDLPDGAALPVEPVVHEVTVR